MKQLVKFSLLLAFSSVSLYFAYKWFYHEQGGTDALLSILGLIYVILDLVFNLSDYLFKVEKKARIEFDTIGMRKSRTPPMDNEGELVKKTLPGGIYKWNLTWAYTLIVRNNSDYGAYKPKIHLLGKFKNIIFPRMNNYKPDKIYIPEDDHIMVIENLHEKEPIKAGNKVLICIQYSMLFQGTLTQLENAQKTYYPAELKDFEVLLELRNGEGEDYFVLMKMKEKEWVSKSYNHKPFRYLKCNTIVYNPIKKNK